MPQLVSQPRVRLLAAGGRAGEAGTQLELKAGLFQHPCGHSWADQQFFQQPEAPWSSCWAVAKDKAPAVPREWLRACSWGWVGMGWLGSDPGGG